MHEIGLGILFSKQEMVWDNASVPMQSKDKISDFQVNQFELDLMFAHDPVATDLERIQNIIDSKYSKADLEKVAQEVEALLCLNKKNC